MKTPPTAADQHYNVQVVVDHDSRLVVGNWLCDHTNDKQAALPTLDTVPPVVGQPKKVNLDTGYFSENNIASLEARGIDPYIATGRSPHHQGWRAFFLDNPNPPPNDASVKEQMAYKLQTTLGKATYRLRKSTVEPVIGIIKEAWVSSVFSARPGCCRWRMDIGLSGLQLETIAYLAGWLMGRYCPLPDPENGL
ncbi:MAG: transposase [Chloroflexi bacterium]|nr:transposase [Chloroflexota bacterium]